MKRSSKFNEKAMRKKLLAQTQRGAPVTTHLQVFPECKSFLSLKLKQKRLQDLNCT